MFATASLLCTRSQEDGLLGLSLNLDDPLQWQKFPPRSQGYGREIERCFTMLEL